jgi:DNA-binding NtrC family response regulator
MSTSVEVMIMSETTSVLIVDDDQAMCDLIGEILAKDGYRCEIALNAHDALGKIQNQPYDIALLDIKLPDKSGIELLEKSLSFSQTTIAIMMTAVNDIDTVIHAMKAGASDYIVKPFTIEKLSASITTVLKDRRRYGSISIQSEKAEENNCSRNTESKSFKTINAIAIGVEAQVDYFDFHSKIVTEKTADLARRLGIPTKEVDKWETSRNKECTEKRQYINSILRHLEQNPLAQMRLGLTRRINEFPKILGERN